MNPLDNVKRNIAVNAASRAMARIAFEKDGNVFTPEDMSWILEHVAYAAIELWNGQIQAEVHLIQTDYRNRLKMVMTEPPKFQTFPIDPEKYRKD